MYHLSRYTTNKAEKAEYYRYLQTVRDESPWAEWCFYLLRWVAFASRSAIILVNSFSDLMRVTK